MSISEMVMKDFEGLEDCDAATKNAVITFSFSLSIGDIDQAFKSIRSIKRLNMLLVICTLHIITGVYPNYLYGYFIK